MARNPSSSIDRGQPITLSINQREVSAWDGETIATVLLAQGITTFNHSAKGQPRGPYCNMGTCFECQVQLADAGNDRFRRVRACMVPARQGMVVKTGETMVANPTGDTAGME